MKTEENKGSSTVCCARSEFTALSEDDVWLAMLTDDAGVHPVTGEIKRLVAELVAQFAAYAEMDRTVPNALKVSTRWPIERVALETLALYAKTANQGFGTATLN